MLYLIGLGLDDGDISIRGIEAVKKCDEAFAETYTSQWAGNLSAIEKATGKRVQTLSREGVESDFLVNMAKKQKVALLVPGDPLSATTHFQLVIDAKKAGIKCEIIHSSSIITSVAETGLHLYKFGRTTTLPKDFKAESPFEAIEKNKKTGLHTLILLDVGMDLKEALETVGKKIGTGEKIIACLSLGTDGQIIKYGTANELKGYFKQITSPSCIIIPGELNFKEEEALELWK
ncbi:MAG: diphthine synthase [Candidatus Aenigmarchaeota archaeon]|nr:diphthine synthase [Candidatus Aenigmarchaeota archaeon]